MQTNDISKFAAAARIKLMNGIASKLTKMGYDKDGVLDENFIPKAVQGGVIINGTVIQDNTYYAKWQSLEKEIKRVGIQQVVEEAAYTWFNRLMAIRILQKNGLAEPVIEYISADVRIPKIVDQARHGVLPELTKEDSVLLDSLLQNDTLTQEQFALLIKAYCHDNVIISKCFGQLDDYSDLLIPDNILADGELLDLINHTDYITDEDFKSPELIGWLYQFYISERKDEVFDGFKKGKKAGANEIPAATQIFTPNWIVKYMVQNTIGRIYLDNFTSTLGGQWQYLVEPAEPTPEDCKLKLTDPAEIKFTDPGCGSGHILVEAFDILLQIYDDQLYSKKEAIELILSKNIIGIDIDTRAKQLATFSLLLKACQVDASFADAHLMPRVLDMPKSVDAYTWKDVSGHMDCAYGIACPEKANMELSDAFNLMKDANILGSIMKFDISAETREFMELCLQKDAELHLFEDAFELTLHCFRLILALTDKYSAVVANPPYMGSGNMCPVLSDYVKAYYDRSKADLFAVFMDVAEERLQANAKYAMINMHSWMFLSSFESLRAHIFSNLHIDNMLHLGARTFDELSGEVVQNTAYVISNHESTINGTYFRLVEGPNCEEKHQLFSNALKQLENPFNETKIYFRVNQLDFMQLPEKTVSYWGSKRLFSLSKFTKSQDSLIARHGLLTGDDKVYLKLWFEVAYNSIGFNCKNFDDISLSNKTFFPMNKGSENRKWYGLNYTIVKLKGCLNNFNNNKISEKSLFFKEGLTWTEITRRPYLRYSNTGFLFGHKGATAFFKMHDDLLRYISFANCKVFTAFKSLFYAGMSFTAGNLERMPYLKENKSDLSIPNCCITISKVDWDSHETSWDFKKSELLAMQDENAISEIYTDYEKFGINLEMSAPEPGSLEWCLDMYKKKWQAKFDILHNNEEELNRQFIDIYGLQDELTPDVPLDEITILQQGEISIEDNRLKWHDDVIMKQFISYAMGCVMGRYKLGADGLHIADMNAPADMIAPYGYKDSTFVIDDDGIVPLMLADCNFSDNGLLAVKEFIRIALGDEHLSENLNFVENCLGCTLEQYLNKDFWKDHKKMYQNRPIYWLFSSKKGAFQALIYMHRYNASTLKQLREHYLLRYIDHLRTKIEAANADFMNLDSKAKKMIAKYDKDLEECLEYDGRLHEMVDNQITLDLDDGVVVNYGKMGDVVAKIK